MPCAHKIFGQERLAIVLFEPLFAGFQHHVVFVAEVVRLLEALGIHRFECVVILVAEVLYETREVLEILGGGLKEDGVVALLLQEAGKARDRDAVGPGLSGRLDEVRFDATVDGDTRLRGVRNNRIILLGKQAVLSQLVQEGRRLEVLIVRSSGPRASRLQVDQDNVALLGLGRLYEASMRSRMLHGTVSDAGISGILLGGRLIYSRQDQVNERVSHKAYTSSRNKVCWSSA